MIYSFSKGLYPKVALLKAAYTFIDSAYIHLDANEQSWIVSVEMKDECGNVIAEKDFINEMLVQSLRHEVYEQTKNIREMLYARSVASSLIVSDTEQETQGDGDNATVTEKDILQDWFEKQ